MEYRRPSREVIESISDSVIICGEKHFKFYCNAYHVNPDEVREFLTPLPEAQALTGKVSKQQILKLIAAGWSKARVQRQFGISEGTLRRFLKHNRTTALNIRPTAGTSLSQYSGDETERLLQILKERSWYLKKIAHGLNPTDEEIIEHYNTIKELKEKRFKGIKI